MRITNKMIQVFCILSIIFGAFNGSIAYDSEIEFIQNYSIGYEKYTTAWVLILVLSFRYFKYILLIQFYVIGYFGKFIVPIIAMYKSYGYGFITSLIFVSFSGFDVIKKMFFVVIQMTLSLIITVLFAQVSMNFLQYKYSKRKMYQIQFFAFVFSLICCIIIGLIDFMIIKLIS